MINCGVTAVVYFALLLVFFGFRETRCVCVGIDTPLRSVPGASCRRGGHRRRNDPPRGHRSCLPRTLPALSAPCSRHRDRCLQVWRKDIHLRCGGCRGRAELRQLGKSWHRAARSYLGQYPGDVVGLATLLGHSSLDTTRLSSQPSTRQLASSVEHLSLNASS